MSFSNAQLAYLATQRLGRLATMQPDGTLQVNPVGFRYNPGTGTIDIGGFTMASSRKFRNVADNGRAAFVVDEIASIDPWRVRCLEIRGHAEASPLLPIRRPRSTAPSSGSIRAASSVSGWAIRALTPAASSPATTLLRAACPPDPARRAFCLARGGQRHSSPGRAESWRGAVAPIRSAPGRE